LPAQEGQPSEHNIQQKRITHGKRFNLGDIYHNKATYSETR
jgi:hypothetical protein